MPEKLYAFLLKLYPDHFRRTYGDEMLRLVADRAASEKGFLRGLRLWLDLLLDFAVSLPREYVNPRATPIVATQSLNGEPTFQLLAERGPNPILLCLGGILSALMFWACVFAVAHTGTFPALFLTSSLLQGLAQVTSAQAQYPYEQESPIRNSAGNLAGERSSGNFASVGDYSFCMTAQRDIPSNSVQPLFVFDFAPPGASGIALIDGRVVKIFKNEQHLSIHAHVIAGDHHFVLHLDRPAESTFMSSNDDIEHCQPK